MQKAAKITVLLLLGMNVSFWGQPISQNSLFTIVRLEYSGGGDWYNDPSCIPNMLSFLQARSGMACAKDEVRLAIMDENLFSYPILFMTGHGRISFSDAEAQRLRLYLHEGGFLFADDDYGMDEYFRQEMKKVFPDRQMLEIPFDHPVFSQFYKFNQGLPKIHEHDGGAPKAYGYFHGGRLVVLYAFNTNISDGWADADVHGDPAEKREEALRFGLNMIIYALMN